MLNTDGCRRGKTGSGKASLGRSHPAETRRTSKKCSPERELQCVGLGRRLPADALGLQPQGSPSASPPTLALSRISRQPGTQQSCACAFLHSARGRGGGVAGSVTSPLFPSGVTAVFRVFPNGLSTPLLGRLFGLPPLATALNLPHPCRPCLSSRLSAPAAEFGCRTQSAFGARPRHSAGRCLSAPAKATPGRVGRRRSGRGAPGRAVPLGPAPRTPVSWRVSERDAPRRPRRRGRGAGNFLETTVLFCVGDSGGVSSQAYRRPHGTVPFEESLDRLLPPPPTRFSSSCLPSA